MPRNVIEQHEVQRAWCAHHPPPRSPPPAMQPQGFAPVLQPMQPQGFIPVLQPMQPYGGAPMMQPMQPPPAIWPQPAPPIHGNIFYEGAAQSRQQEGIHIHHFPQQQQQQHHLLCKLQRMLMQRDIEIVEGVMEMLLLHLLPPFLTLLNQITMVSIWIFTNI
ncbi:hypothetical protein BDN67DRAFT_1017908 [Paxillus ammoniavirescens]|nr:hypothetical protein BDN67DRAFT_1017908 [Paxillus ammoniavirescens]